MAAEGANIIDIGGYSTRPGAVDISIKEEIDRVLPVVKMATELVPEIPVSIDTFRSQVAEAAIQEGAAMINDVSGGNLDRNMFQLTAKLQVPYVLMHMRGTPQSMSSKNQYQHLVTDIAKDLSGKLFQLKELGVNDVIADPGFGFAKDPDQNYHLLNKLDHFQALGVPILVGLSRKSMIYRTLGISAEDSLNATSVLNTIALMKGASILRVHDVKPAVEAVQLFVKTRDADATPASTNNS